METFSALLAIGAGNSPVTGEFPAQRQVTQSFNVFFDLRLNKPLSKQWWGWWFETLWRPLWRHCNVNHYIIIDITSYHNHIISYYIISYHIRYIYVHFSPFLWNVKYCSAHKEVTLSGFTHIRVKTEKMIRINTYYDMESFSSLLTLCERNLWIDEDSSYNQPVMRSFDISFMLASYAIGQIVAGPVIWDGMLLMWRHCNVPLVARILHNVPCLVHVNSR